MIQSDSQERNGTADGTRILRAAVIGAGAIAREHMKCLAERSDVEVVAVCDLSAASGQAAAERYGVHRSFTHHSELLKEARPDVVHVATPPQSHFAIARDALLAGCHVIVEKPVTVSYEDAAQLLELARERELILVEDQNYLFNGSIQRIFELLNSGEFGEVISVEVSICLDIISGGRFSDTNVPHPTLAMPGGAIFDFLPHLASLAWGFVGRHHAVATSWEKKDPATPLPYDEFRALVRAERGTASLSFSAHTQPDVFWVRVNGTKMRASANMFEPRLTLDRVRTGLRPLIPLFNGLKEARDVRRAAIGGLWRKLAGGPGAYEGLWRLVGQTYDAIQGQAPVPVSLAQVDDVSRLVQDLTATENRL
ncbi:MAG: Gfo/Idh/MocA family oxidoreductase [Planctomycetota bacterium]